MRPTYDEMKEIFETLQQVTGQELLINEGFVMEKGQLVFGDDCDQLVTQKHFDEVSQVTGMTADFIQEWAEEYYDHGRCWSDLGE